ncbi:tetraspanin-19-like isoform X1 [Mangifera indica]|uniref:tetraspanin-19-like isoform X1 n=1 Tax=Mangifera indica TaxID=29780 RepID=UPI001CFA8F2D|nr:tetraspanin-19-like isoform X1 [Mangifera indica]
MARIARAYPQSFLKAVNLVIGMVGIAMILYGLWIIRVWQRDMQDSSFEDSNSTAPRFIYKFLVIGVSYCHIAGLGHIAADSANRFCLSCYMTVIFLLLLLESAMTADILLNFYREKDLPDDPTGRFQDFKEFVTSISSYRWAFRSS